MTVFKNRQRRGEWRYDFELGGKRYHGPCVDAVTGKPAASRKQALELESLARWDRRPGRRDIAALLRRRNRDHPFPAKLSRSRKTALQECPQTAPGTATQSPPGVLAAPRSAARKSTATGLRKKTRPPPDSGKD